MSWRSVAANTALAIGSTLLGLLAIEGYLRWTKAFEIPDTSDCYAFSDNPRLIYDHKPHCEGANAYGMREEEIDASREERRIIALGDSITFAPGIPIEWTWPKQLQRRIVRDGGGTKVLNFAVQGYSTLQEVETLRTKALALKPRGVLLQYFMNDEEIYTALFIGILEDRRKRNQVGYVEAFHSVDPGDSWLVRKLLLSRTAIAIRLGLARLSAPSGDAAPSTDAIYEYYTKNSPVREGLEDLKRIVAEHHLPVLVLVFPHAWGARADRMGTALPEMDEYPNAWVFDNTRVLALCRELGFTCIDLTAKLHDRPKLRRIRPERLFLDGCCHLGILGHKVMGWITYRELLREGWFRR
jgi:hypothetical protein